jgi:hypothetical protein
MGGHPFSAIPCTICTKPVDLTVDLSADENGTAVHTDCYVKRIKESSESAKVPFLIAR